MTSVCCSTGREDLFKIKSLSAEKRSPCSVPLQPLYRLWSGLPLAGWGGGKSGTRTLHCYWKGSWLCSEGLSPKRVAHSCHYSKLTGRDWQHPSINGLNFCHFSSWEQQLSRQAASGCQWGKSPPCQNFSWGGSLLLCIFSREQLPSYFYFYYYFLTWPWCE